MAIMPIINADSVHTHYIHAECIDFSEHEIKPVDVSHECGVSKYAGKHWIWFSEGGETRYYAIPFKCKKDATEMLIKIMECKYRD